MTIIGLTAALLGSTLAPAPAAVRSAQAESRIETAQRIADEKLALTDATVPVGRYPFYTSGPSDWKLDGGTGWVYGFLPGSLWYRYERVGDEAARASAIRRQLTLAPNARTTRNHDIGFMFLTSYGNGYRLTGDPQMRQTLLTAADSLSERYDSRVGMVRTTNTPNDFWVYNDTMMNIELLFWGARNGGDPKWRSAASSHALRTAEDFLRPGGGSYHYVAYSETTGRPLRKGQGQGYADESTWSRGQAWIIYGMTVAYRETGDARFLTAARRATEYWIANVPEDFVPYWDFNAPNIPDEPRDSSAAAVVASACLELAELDPDRAWRTTYRDLAESTLQSLSSSAYLADADPLPAVLRHGTHAKMLGAYDHGTSWGDYYFREALMRLTTPVERVGGPDRYHTSARTSSAAFDSADVAVVASGEGFADALAASALAGSLDAPVLLTGRASVPGPIRSEIVRLGVRRVIVVGGTNAVSAQAESELAGLPGIERVERIAGQDRYSTAASIAEQSAESGVPLLFIARGDEFADALAAGPVAYAQGAPVLLTTGSALHPDAEAALRALRPGRVVVLGGKSSISAAVEDRVRQVMTEKTSLEPRTTAPDSTRIGGTDRYDTAALVAQWADVEGYANLSHIAVVSGGAFPDALGAAAAVGSQGGVLLMSARDKLAVPTWGALGSAAAEGEPRVTVYGGESVVSGRVAHEIFVRVR